MSESLPNTWARNFVSSGSSLVATLMAQAIRFRTTRRAAISEVYRSTHFDCYGGNQRSEVGAYGRDFLTAFLRASRISGELRMGDSGGDFTKGAIVINGQIS